MLSSSDFNGILALWLFIFFFVSLLKLRHPLRVCLRLFFLIWVPFFGFLISPQSFSSHLQFVCVVPSSALISRPHFQSLPTHLSLTVPGALLEHTSNTQALPSSTLPVPSSQAAREPPPTPSLFFSGILLSWPLRPETQSCPHLLYHYKNQVKAQCYTHHSHC